MGELDRARTMTFVAVSNTTASKSRSLGLMLQPGLDPITDATCMPVMMLLRAVWENWVPLHMVVRCLQDKRATTWAHVQGQCVATVMSLRRIGWAVQEANSWVMDDGNTIAPLGVAPWVVRKLVMRGVLRWQWRQVSKDPGCSHLAAGGELEPL
eukprot:3453189-Pyramimonas_sp.AAC.1